MEVYIVHRDEMIDHISKYKKKKKESIVKEYKNRRNWAGEGNSVGIMQETEIWSYYA